MSLKRNYFYSSTIQLSNLLFPLVTIPYVSKIIGPEGIGKSSFIMNLVQFFIMFAALGIPAYGMREIARFKHDKIKRTQFFNELVTLNFINSILCTVLYVLLVLLTDKIQNDLNYFLFAGCFILLSFTNIDWFFTGLEEFKLITLRNLIVKLGSIFLLLLLVKSEADFSYYFAISFLGLFVNNFINFLYLRKYISFTFSLNFNHHLKSLLLLFATIFATSIYCLMNTTILGFLTNNIFVGYFNFSIKLYQIYLPFVTSMGLVILPQMVVAFERGNMVEYNNLLEKLVSFNFIISLPIAVFIFLFSNDLILFLTDRRYLPAVISTQILAPLIIIVGFSNILMLQVLNIMRLEKYMLFTVITAAVISLLANYILIPLYFHVGAAIATLLSELIVSVSLIYFVYHKTSIRINFRIVFYCMISLIPYFILFYFLSSKINNFIVKSIIINVGGLTAYILLLYYLFKQELVLLIFNRIMIKIR